MDCWCENEPYRVLYHARHATAHLARHLFAAPGYSLAPATVACYTYSSTHGYGTCRDSDRAAL
jgi:hypothetical protein